MSLKQAQAALEKTLKRTRYSGKLASRPDFPDYRITENAPLSNCIGLGTARTKMRYTGTEIAGVVLNHKSCYEPVRRDNLQAAREAAHMRR